jgi:hypothetical protein
MIVRHTQGLVGFDVPDDSAIAVTARRRALLAHMARTHGRYPQYADTLFDPSWRLATTRHALRFKGGNVPSGTDVLTRTLDRQTEDAMVDEGMGAPVQMYDAVRGWFSIVEARDLDVIA